MRASDIRSFDPVRYGAYICLDVPAASQAAAADADVPALAERLGLRNEYGSAGGDPPRSIAYLRRVSAVPGQVTDAGLLGAEAIVHVAAAAPEPVAEFRAGLARLLGPAVTPRVLAGVVRPFSYTGQAMFNFSYGQRVLQQPGTVMPNAFLVPVSKTARWWQKDWMERHTDFVSYLECADADVPVFHDVCDALRDLTRNPEWAFVREGPTWHGRRTPTWSGLFA